MPKVLGLWAHWKAWTLTESHKSISSHRVYSLQWEGRWQWKGAKFLGRRWARQGDSRFTWGPVPKPFLPSWGPSVRRFFSQYIFSSLVHNSNLDKRFELQSRLTQHILWAMTAICVKKIKKERACWRTWAGVTESEAERQLKQQAGSERFTLLKQN